MTYSLRMIEYMMWLRRMYELAMYERDQWHAAYEASERECAALRAEVERLKNRGWFSR